MSDREGSPYSSPSREGKIGRPCTQGRLYRTEVSEGQFAPWEQGKEADHKECPIRYSRHRLNAQLDKTTCLQCPSNLGLWRIIDKDTLSTFYVHLISALLSAGQNPGTELDGRRNPELQRVCPIPHDGIRH